jgi:hypothetical protein
MRALWRGLWEEFTRMEELERRVDGWEEIHCRDDELEEIDGIGYGRPGVE